MSSVTNATKASSALGVLAAVAVGVLLNVVVARQYKRWDWTSSQLYTLSSATRTTLQELPEPVEITVLLSAGDPLMTSVRHLLTAYHAETDRLGIRYLDPDKSPADFLAFQQKHDLRAGRTEEGRIVADAAIVVAKREKRWFLTPTDLVDVSEADEGKSRPKLEQGLTTAIRNVLGGQRTQLCFSKGHGELALEEPGPHGLGEFRHRLERNNVDILAVDAAALDGKPEPWRGCDLVLVVSPQQPWAEKEALQLSATLQQGTALFLLLNPVLDPEKKHTLPSGLEAVIALGGMELHNDLIFEQDKAQRLPSGQGEAFLAQPKAHPITEGLLGARAANAKILAILSQSLGKKPAATVLAADLLTTSSEAFARLDFLAGSDDEHAPIEKRSSDRPGPLVIAMAAELPKAPGSTSAHGPRLVVAGTGSVVQGQAWQEPALRGGALFVESAVSWLTSKPEIVDIPPKPSVQAGLRISEESFSQVRTYVLFYIPLAVILVGVAVFLRRRSTERQRERSA